LKLGDSIKYQTRRVYSLLDFGSDVGGLYGSIQPLFGFIVALFSGAMFNSEIVTGLFPVRVKNFKFEK